MIPFLKTLSRWRIQNKFKRKYEAWKDSGSPLPMPHYGKKLVLEDYVRRCRPRVFIETGTYKGDMVFSMMDHFEELISIELDKTLHRQAVQRFARYPQVRILQGESDQVLRELLPTLQSPCLFWLDAHYSMGRTAKGALDTPIIQELENIFSSPLADRHVLLIDDARCFDGTNDYPAMEELKSFILNRRPDWSFEVKDDIIRTCHKNLSKQ